jgi:hypothetical protein
MEDFELRVQVSGCRASDFGFRGWELRFKDRGPEF